MALYNVANTGMGQLLAEMCQKLNTNHAVQTFHHLRNVGFYLCFQFKVDGANNYFIIIAVLYCGLKTVSLLAKEFFHRAQSFASTTDGTAHRTLVIR